MPPNQFLNPSGLFNQVEFFLQLTQQIEQAVITREYVQVVILQISPISLAEDTHQVIPALMDNYTQIFTEGEMIGYTKNPMEFTLATTIKQPSNADRIIQHIEWLIKETDRQLGNLGHIRANVSYHYQVPDELTFADNLIDLANKSTVVKTCVASS
jgi:hypothetical protein